MITRCGKDEEKRDEKFIRFDESLDVSRRVWNTNIINQEVDVRIHENIVKILVSWQS